MGRAVRQSDAPQGASEAEAALGRRLRQLALRVGLTVMATDPPAHPDVRTTVARDLAHAQALSPARARHDAIEAVGRKHYGEATVERWLSFRVRPIPPPFTDPHTRSEVTP